MFPQTENLANVYASADPQAITVFYSHKAVERALSNGLDSARESLKSKAIEILGVSIAPSCLIDSSNMKCQTYRKELAGGNMGGGGLQLPQK